MTRKDGLKIITLIMAAAFWTSPDFAAEISHVRTYKASRVVARPTNTHRSSLQPVDPSKIAWNTANAHRSSLQSVEPCKIAWNTGPLILGIGF
jgi:hypothetical protein